MCIRDSYNAGVEIHAYIVTIVDADAGFGTFQLSLIHIYLS